MPLRVYLPLWGFYVYAVLLSCKHHHHYNKTENPHTQKKHHWVFWSNSYHIYSLTQNQGTFHQTFITLTLTHWHQGHTKCKKKKKNHSRKTSKIAVHQYKWIRQVLAIATVYSDESRTWTAFACWLHVHSRYSNESFKAVHCTGAFKSHVHLKKKKRCFL